MLKLDRLLLIITAVFSLGCYATNTMTQPSLPPVEVEEVEAPPMGAMYAFIEGVEILFRPLEAPVFLQVVDLEGAWGTWSWVAGPDPTYPDLGYHLITVDESLTTPFELEQILIHELAHAYEHELGIEGDHDKRFWALVGRIDYAIRN
jgi:hypothetical protein